MCAYGEGRGLHIKREGVWVWVHIGMVGGGMCVCAHIERECVHAAHMGGGGGCIYREGQCVHIWRGRVCVCVWLI